MHGTFTNHNAAIIAARTTAREAAIEAMRAVNRDFRERQSGIKWSHFNAKWSPTGDMIFSHVRPAGKTPSLLEAHHIPERSCVAHYCGAIRDWIAERISEEQMFSLMGTR